MALPKTLPIQFVEEGGLAAAALAKPQAQWAAANGFSGQRGRLLAMPSATGGIDGYLFGTGAPAGSPASPAPRSSPAAIGSKAQSAIRPMRRSAFASAPTASTATRRAGPRPT